MGQFEAAQEAVEAVRKLGVLEPEDGAILQMVVGLAAAVEADPGNASLWREYRGALNDLRKIAGDGGDSFGEAMERLSAAVRNAGQS